MATGCLRVQLDSASRALLLGADSDRRLRVTDGCERPEGCALRTCGAGRGSRSGRLVARMRLSLLGLRLELLRQRFSLSQDGFSDNLAVAAQPESGCGNSVVLGGEASQILHTQRLERCGARGWRDAWGGEEVFTRRTLLDADERRPGVERRAKERGNVAQRRWGRRVRGQFRHSLRSACPVSSMRHTQSYTLSIMSSISQTYSSQVKTCFGAMLICSTLMCVRLRKR